MIPLWKQALEIVRATHEESDADALLSTLRPVRLHGKTLLVEAPDRATLVAVQPPLLRLVEEAVSQIAGAAMRVVVQPPSQSQQELFPLPPVPNKPRDVDRQRRQAGLIDRLTFDNFVVGGGSQFAHAACRAVANLPGETYNPLFLYGASGLGKTHLVHAIGNAIIDRNPATRVLYVTSESFMNELITAIRRDRMADLKARFRRVEVLIVDDVQLLAGRERTQEEFFHTFNALYENRRQIILTSDRFPKEIPQLEERLRNRFEWGLIADLQPPDVETRVAILQKRAESDGLDLEADVALFLATRVESNVRDLESCLTRLAALSSLRGLPLNLELAHELFPEVAAAERSLITIDSIQQAVCDYFKIKNADLRSKRRTRTIAVPRQVAMYLCRRLTDASYPSIGDRFGGRDHSTVIHATQVVDERMKHDPALRSAVERISRMLETSGERYGKSGERL